MRGKINFTSRSNARPRGSGAHGDAKLASRSGCECLMGTFALHYPIFLMTGERGASAGRPEQSRARDFGAFIADP